MTTRQKNTGRKAALLSRLRKFYALLNAGKFARCFALVDPQTRSHANAVTLSQYRASLDEFRSTVGEVQVLDADFAFHLGEASELYGGRDFAVGQTRWRDAGGCEHVTQERWVRTGRWWYTRASGLVAPARADKRTARRA